MQKTELEYLISSSSSTGWNLGAPIPAKKGELRENYHVSFYKKSLNKSVELTKNTISSSTTSKWRLELIFRVWVQCHVPVVITLKKTDSMDPQLTLQYTVSIGVLSSLVYKTQAVYITEILYTVVGSYWETLSILILRESH